MHVCVSGPLRRRQRVAEPLGESRREPSGRANGDLLAENRADGHLVTVPSARDAHPGALREQRRKAGIRAEMVRDRLEIRIDVEDSPDAGGDLRNGRRMREANRCV